LLNLFSDPLRRKAAISQIINIYAPNPEARCQNMSTTTPENILLISQNMTKPLRLR